MSTTVGKQNKKRHQLLVEGYLREMKSDNVVHVTPKDVIYLVLYYHPSYLLYGIGKYVFGDKYSFSDYISKLCDDPISICTAFESLVFRTINNDIYIFGQSALKSLHSTKQLNINRMYDGFDNNRKELIIAGSITSLIIADNNNKLIYGKLYDDNCEYDLIHQTVLNKIYDICQNQKIHKICCTSYSSMILLQNGCLYYHKSGSSQLKICDNLPKIIDMEMSICHGLFIDENTNLWVVGHNKKGQLGLDIIHHSFIMNITQNTFFNDKIVSKVLCTHNHSCIICQDGMCYLMGDNALCQTAPKMEGNIVESPYLFQNMYKDLKIIEGALGYFHSMLLTNKRYIYGFGLNTDHQICAEDVDLIPFAKMISYTEIGIDNEFEKIVKIMATQVNTIIITGFIYESKERLVEAKEVNVRKRKYSEMTNVEDVGLQYMKCNNGNKMSL